MSEPPPAGMQVWIDVFWHVAQRCRFAMLLVDVREGGLPIKAANEAAATLSGYAEASWARESSSSLQSTQLYSARQFCY